MNAMDKLKAKAKSAEDTRGKKSETTATESKNRNVQEIRKTTEVGGIERKHPGGRPNTRGNYKMVNIAVPEDVYNRIKEVCNGNMTYYINDLLRKSVDI